MEIKIRRTMLFGIKLKEDEKVVKTEVIQELQRKEKLLESILEKNSFEIANTIYTYLSTQINGSMVVTL